MGIFDLLFKKKAPISPVDRNIATKQSTQKLMECSNWDMESDNDKKAIQDLVYHQTIIRNSQPGNIFAIKLSLNGVTRPILFTIDSQRNLSEMHNAIALPSTFKCKKMGNIGVVVFSLEFITNQYLDGLQSVVGFIERRPQGASARINMPTTTVRECVFVMPSDKENLLLLASQEKWLLLLVDSSFKSFKWLDIANKNWKVQIEQYLSIVKDCKEATNQFELKQIMDEYYNENPMESILCSDIERLSAGMISPETFPIIQSKIEEILKMFNR